MITMVYDDFTGFSEVDPDDELTVTANKIHIIDQNHDGDSRVYKDYGVDYFDGNFIHKFELMVVGGSMVFTGIWGMFNSSGGLGDPGVNYAYVSVFPDEEYGCDFCIGLYAPEESAGSTGLLFGTRYYVTVKREGNNWTLTIRTGSHAGEVIDEIGFPWESPEAFRYLYAQLECIEEEEEEE